MWVLVIEPRFSARETSAINYWPISLTPSFNKNKISFLRVSHTYFDYIHVHLFLPPNPSQIHPSYTFKKLSLSRFPGPLVLKIFARPLLQCSLSLKCRDCIVDVLTGDVHLALICSPWFAQLWFQSWSQLLQKEASFSLYTVGLWTLWAYALWTYRYVFSNFWSCHRIFCRAIGC